MTCHRMGEIPTCRKNGNPSKGLCVVIDAITYWKGKEHQGQTGCSSKSTSYAQPIRRFSSPKPLHRVLNRGGWKRKRFQEPLRGAWPGSGLSGSSSLSGLFVCLVRRTRETKETRQTLKRVRSCNQTSSLIGNHRRRFARYG